MLTPINNLIMVEKSEVETKTASGLIIGADHTQAQTAEVIAKGPDAGPAVNIGDKIILDHENEYQTAYITYSPRLLVVFGKAHRNYSKNIDCQVQYRL